jgi:hypothetical protein
VEEHMHMTPDAPSPTERQRRRFRLPLAVGLVFAFALALGAGAFFGTSLFSTAQAANPTQDTAQTFQTLASTSTPGGQGPGQCEVLTVTSVSGQTITAKASDGTTVTIHPTSSTVYTKGGQSVTASSITAGVQIHVQGPRNSDGSISATRIDIG